ncbi:MAG: NUDIX hydrolase [Muribaculaceae bacterium]|nr:NUDIX hydrolase [Muribaculaceae bacterium]
MTDYYSEHSRFLVSVDCIVFGIDNGGLSLLLVKRRFEPHEGEWSLVGGFVRDCENVDDAAKRVLYELTGLDDMYMEQVAVFGKVDRDPGERVISVAYFAVTNLADIDQQRMLDYDAGWFNVDKLPKLYFDHNEMVTRARRKLRRRTVHDQLGLSLLPELFTLTQMQALYESLLGESVDKRNFRKRVSEMPYIVKTEHIDKSSSRRGATLYRYTGEATTDQFKI